MAQTYSKSKVLTGMFWSALELLINRAFDFIIKLILAKILFPSEFGLVGMAVVFTSFIQVFNDAGIGAALIQRKDSELTEKHYNTCFWTGIVWSVFLYLIVSFIVGPLAASFYDQPLMRSIIPVLSIGILSSSVNTVHRSQLTKQLNFKALAVINNISNIFSGILSLCLAYFGFGIWALVFNSVSSFIIAMPLLFKATGWRPKFIWDKEAFKDVFGFGMYTTGTQVVNNITSNIDYLLIGKLISASALGAYTLAFMLTDIVRSQVMGIMNKVMYPVYGAMQNDSKSISKYYLTVVKYNAVILFPIMIFLIVMGGPFILNFFGEKWIEAVAPLKILAVSVLFHIMVSSNTSLIRGLGRPDLEMKIQFYKTVFLYVPSIIVGTYYFGIIGAGYAILVNKIISVVIAQHYLKKLLQIEWRDLFSSIRDATIASIIAGSLSFVIYKYLNVHYLISSVMLGLFYCLIIWYLMKDEILNLVNSLRRKAKK